MTALYLRGAAEDAWRLHASHEPVTLNGPAAGAALTYTVPGAVQVRVLSVSFTYTASAAAATRIPLVRFLDQSGVAFCEVGAPFTLVANDASRITFAVGIVQFGANSAARMGAGIPPIVLQDGLQIQVTATAIAAADTITTPRLYVHQTPVQALG